jgi:hypothetical protein
MNWKDKWWKRLFIRSRNITNWSSIIFYNFWTRKLSYETMTIKILDSLETNIKLRKTVWIKTGLEWDF